MSVIIGKWYPKDSSTQHLAHLVLESTSYQVQIKPNELSQSLSALDQTSSESLDSFTDQWTLTGQWAEVTINERLGNTERKLTLADGSLFTTQDNDAVDALIKRHKSSDLGSRWNLLLHKHETKMSSVLAMLVLTIVFAFGFVKWGIPWTSHVVAHALPQQTGEYIGEQSLDFMDRYFLEPTRLIDAEQQLIISRFDKRLRPVGDDGRINYTLHFRDMRINGVSLPNAFALPSGDIILTDKFVELSQHEDQIDAVVLHEMGHVEKRHSLQMLTQNSLTTMIVMLVLGNPDGISELATGLGTALVSNHYSREYETEADEFAFQKMLKIGIDPESFVAILSQMEAYSNTALESEHTDDADEDKLSDFLSTHPNTQSRIKMAKKYSQCFKQGLTVCE